MKIYDIETVSTYGQVHSVVADNMAQAERIFKAKYWPTDIKTIRLHSDYVQIQKWDEQAKESVTKAPEPPVDDSLAKARELYKSVHGKNSFPSLVEWTMIHDSYESALRERDEKLSQSMTVEELMKWGDSWSAREPYYIYIRQKIKERNEKEAGR